MQVYQRAAVAAFVMIAGCLPFLEIVWKGSYLRRGDPSRTKRRDDPVGYWRVTVLTAVLAITSLAAGVAIWLGLLKP
jgi:hypothetical protein